MATFFSKEHEWVRVEGNVGVVGITTYAADQLGDVTFVELPRVGKEVKQFEALAGIESVKAASDIYAPVSGKVVEINEALDATPELVNESAEENAWLAKIEIADEADLKNLMSREAYEEYVRGLE